MTPTDRHALHARAKRLIRAREDLAAVPKDDEGRAFVEAATEEAQARQDVEAHAATDILALLAALEAAEAVAAAAGAWLDAQRDLERCKRNEEWEALSPALARVGAAFEALRAAVARWEEGEN